MTYGLRFLSSLVDYLNGSGFLVKHGMFLISGFGFEFWITVFEVTSKKC